VSGSRGERDVTASFLFPFRGRRRLWRWAVGSLLVAVLPVSFVVVFGYTVGCIRVAAADAAAGPPGWRVRRRLLSDGAWSGLQAAVLTLPFVTLAWLASGELGQAWHPTGDRFVDSANALVVAVAAVALPWGVLMLTAVPPTVARFAMSGRPADLASLTAVVQAIRGRFADWNLVIVTITTSWLLAAAGLAVALIGVVPGAYYAILVSAHACAALSPDCSAR